MVVLTTVPALLLQQGVSALGKAAYKAFVRKCSNGFKHCRNECSMHQCGSDFTQAGGIQCISSLGTDRSVCSSEGTMTNMHRSSVRSPIVLGRPVNMYAKEIKEDGTEPSDKLIKTVILVAVSVVSLSYGHSALLLF